MLRFSSRRRAKAPRRAPRRHSPRGISVIEIMIALTILGVVMMSLGKLSVMVSMRGRTNELVASRTFAMQQQSNKFSSMPIDSVRTFPTVAQTLTSGSFSYIRRLTITQPVVGVSRYVVKIVIVPLSDTTKKDSLTIDRALPPGNTVLCGGCP